MSACPARARHGCARAEGFARGDEECGMVLAPGITTPLDTVAEGAGPVSPTLDGAGQEPYGPLNTVLLGVLGRLDTHQAGDPRAITEAFRQSIALGETFAGEGHSASSLIHV